MKIILCMIPEVWSATEIIFCHSRPFFALLPPYGPRKLNFWKNEPHNWRRYNFRKCTIYDCQMIYGSWDMKSNRYNFLSFWTVCCLFTPSPPPPLPSLTTLKIKILKNWNPGDIITLHMCTVNDNHMMYSSVLLFSW